jgi:hypothetical protein
VRKFCSAGVRLVGEDYIVIIIRWIGEAYGLFGDFERLVGCAGPSGIRGSLLRRRIWGAMPRISFGRRVC